MAVTTHSMVLHWGPDFDGCRAQPGPWGAATLTSCQVAPVEGTVVALASRASYAAGIRLVSGATSGTYQTPARAVGALSSWGPGQVLLRDGSIEASVKVRIHDGAGNAYYHNGTTWVAATNPTTHWNAVGDLYARLPSWTGRTLGFVVKLSRTLTSDASPVLAGIRAVARVLFAQTGSDATRAASWRDDLVHRILIASMQSQIVVPGVEEWTVKTGATGAISFAGGVNEYPYDVRGVEAVYDLTAAPLFSAALAGTWNGTAKTWTPGAALTVGNRVHARFQFAPWAEHSGDVDFFADKLPAIVVGAVTTSRRRVGTGPDKACTIYDAAVNQAVVVDAPDVEDVTLACRILAARSTDAQRILERVVQVLGHGYVVVSPSTSLPVALEVVGSDEEVDVIGSHAEARFTVLASGWQCWRGQERSGYRLSPGGFVPSAAKR